MNRLLMRQHGVVSREQVLALGADSSWLARHVRSSGLITLHAGVYASPAVRATWERRLSAARLAVGDHARVSHRSAAVLEGFPTIRAGMPELTVAHGLSARGPARVHRSNYLPAADVTVVDGFPVTTPIRTAIDLSAVIRDPKRLRAILNDRLHANAFSLDEFMGRFVAVACRGRRCVAIWRPILDVINTEEHYVPTESVLESMVLDVLEAGGIRRPIKQAPLPTMDGEPGRVDFLFMPERLILEADGRWHRLTEEQIERDQERDIEALARGYSTMRIKWLDLMKRPAWVCRMVRAALAPALAG
jgi:hypothetical protein